MTVPFSQRVIERPQSTGEKLARGLHGAASEGIPMIAQHLMGKRQQLQENEAFEREFGINAKGFTPDIKKLIAQNVLKKKKEDFTRFSTGLQTLDAMEAIKNRGNVGRGTSIKRLFGGQAAQDAAEYEQLGKSLIPIVAAGVPIRNQREFDEYKKVLVDASSSDAEIQGAIDGLRRILSSKLEQEEEGRVKKRKKEKFNQKNPAHDKKALQLKESGKSEEEARKILGREFVL